MNNKKNTIIKIKNNININFNDIVIKNTQHQLQPQKSKDKVVNSSGHNTKKHKRNDFVILNKNNKQELLVSIDNIDNLGDCKGNNVEDINNSYDINSNYSINMNDTNSKNTNNNSKISKELINNDIITNRKTIKSIVKNKLKSNQQNTTSSLFKKFKEKIKQHEKLNNKLLRSDLNYTNISNLSNDNLNLSNDNHNLNIYNVDNYTNKHNRNNNNSFSNNCLQRCKSKNEIRPLKTINKSGKAFKTCFCKDHSESSILSIDDSIINSKFLLMSKGSKNAFSKDNSNKHKTISSGSKSKSKDKSEQKSSNNKLDRDDDYNISFSYSENEDIYDNNKFPRESDINTNKNPNIGKENEKEFKAFCDKLSSKLTK